MPHGAKRSNNLVLDFKASVIFDTQHEKWLQWKSSLQKNAVASKNHVVGAAKSFSASVNKFVNPIRFAGESLPAELILWNNDQERKIGGNSVYDQGDTSECVSYSGCTMIEYYITKYNPSITQVCLSKKHPYGWRYNYPNEGMEMRDFINIVLDKGVLKELDFQRLEQEEQRAWAMFHQQQSKKQKKLTPQQQIEYKRLLANIQQSAFVMAQDVAGNNVAGQNSFKEEHIENTLQNQRPAPIFRLKQTVAGLTRSKKIQSKRSVNVLPHVQVACSDNNSVSDNRVSMNESDHVRARLYSPLDIKRALLYNGPCPIIVPVVDMENPNGMIWDGTESGDDEMGHCMTIIGYSDKRQAFLIRNSWDETWGPMHNGHVWMPYAHIDQGKFWEAWTVFIGGKQHLHYVQTYLKENNNSANAQASSETKRITTSAEISTPSSRSNCWMCTIKKWVGLA